MLEDITTEIESFRNPEKAKILQRYFKTGKGEYAEGDVFLGLTVPQVRMIAKRFAPDAGFSEMSCLLESEVHEYRLCALLILVFQYQNAKKQKNTDFQKNILDFYLGHTKGINNRDLVDLSCYKILGDWLLTYPNQRKLLFQLMDSKNFRERRIAIVSCYPLIKNGEFAEILQLAKQALGDSEPLIWKATGRMLREVGKKDSAILFDFLDNFSTQMPRIMLSYATEKLTQAQKKQRK